MAGKRRALLISTGTYQDSAFRQLSAPQADVEALGAVLTDPAIGAYEITTLGNSASHEVNQEIEDFFGTSSPDDQVILYFSGHGLKDDKGRLYLITTNSKMRLLASTAVSAQFIREQLDQCRSRRKIVILDCCYAGAFLDPTTRGDPSIDVLERLSGRGSVVMTAASAIGYALEGRVSPSVKQISQVPPSVFTSALIDGLATGSADQDGDGLIDIDELYDHVYKKVKEIAPEQTPGRGGSVEGKLYVATNPRGPRPAQLPAEFGDAVQNPLPSVRLAIVRELVTLSSDGRPGTVLAVHDALTKLADDDSRRVATAARSALDAVAERARAIGIGDKIKQQIEAVIDNMDTAARVLSLAQQTSDQAIADARREADETVGRAWRDADDVLTKARRQAEQITADARARAESLERDFLERHRQALGSIVTQREAIAQQVDDLTAQERDHRSRFKSYLEGQLRDLENTHWQGPVPSLAGVEEIRAFENEYKSRVKAYFEGQLRDLEASAIGTRAFLARSLAPSLAPTVARSDQR